MLQMIKNTYNLILFLMLEINHERIVRLLMVVKNTETHN